MDTPTFRIRTEQPEDLDAIYQVNTAAFGKPGEAKLVDLLREEGALTVSLVAELDGEVVGHIAFSPVTLDRQPEDAAAAGLGPMAVLPEVQRQGIGLRLIRAGLEACQDAGVEMVVVLGHPGYYPKAGFVSSTQFGITCKWKVPEEVFMVQALKAGALTQFGGVVQYHPAFDKVT